MTEHEPVPLSEVDLSDLDRFRDDQAWGQFDTLRREDPLHWNEEPAGRGFWSVTRYDDIWAVDKDTEAFSSEEFVNLEDVDPEFRDLRRSMLETDGPRHQAMRALISREFSPRNLMKNYEGFLRELTKQTVDEAFENDEFDFVEKISGDFPIQVLARLLDVPKEDTGQLIAWGDEMVGNTDPDYTDHPLDSPESEKYKHLPFRSPRLRRSSTTDGRSATGARAARARTWSACSPTSSPWTGSRSPTPTSTTTSCSSSSPATRPRVRPSATRCSGSCEQPDQLRAMQEDPSLIASGLEELLRWASPVYHFRRTATRDVEMHGKTIREGDKVVMWFASGNRDESRVPRPLRDRRDASQRRPPDLRQGQPAPVPGQRPGPDGGPADVRGAASPLGSIELGGDVTRVRSNFVNGIKKFPVVVTSAEPTDGTSISISRRTYIQSWLQGHHSYDVGPRLFAHSRWRAAQERNRDADVARGDMVPALRQVHQSPVVVVAADHLEPHRQTGAAEAGGHREGRRAEQGADRGDLHPAVVRRHGVPVDLSRPVHVGVEGEDLGGRQHHVVVGLEQRVRTPGTSRSASPSRRRRPAADRAGYRRRR